MCEPTTIVMVIGLVVGAVAGVQEAKIQKQAGESNAAIAENNARLAEASAQDAAVQGARESQQAAWRTRALIGAQQTQIAANGLDAEVGSAYDLQAEAALLGGAEQSVLSMNAARQAWGFGAEALNYRNKGAQDKWFGKVSSQTTLLKTFGNTLSGAAGMAGGGGGGMFSKAGGSATSITPRTSVGTGTD
jgi:hypothetical protein